MCRTIITNGTIVNDGEHFIGSIIVKGEFIESVIKGKLPENIVYDTDRIIDASGKWILPGVIDDQVHFREPGLTHKAEIATESVAAVAGGITSFMEIPNTVPQTTTLEALEWKYSRAAEVSPANYSLYRRYQRQFRGTETGRLLTGLRCKNFHGIIYRKYAGRQRKNITTDLRRNSCAHRRTLRTRIHYTS